MKGWWTFSVKGESVCLLCFMGSMVSLAATQPCCLIAEAAADPMSAKGGWVSIKLGLQTLELEFHTTFKCHEIIFF